MIGVGEREGWDEGGEEVIWGHGVAV